MSNWALIYRNDAADATFTATNDSGYPESNLANTRLDKVYRRTATVTALTVDIDFGASSSLIGETDWGVVVGGTTLGDGAQMSVITDDNSGFSSATTIRTLTDLFDVTLSNPVAWQQPWGRHGIHLESSDAAERYARLSFTESGGTVLQAAFVFAGPVWTPGKSFDIGWEARDEYLPGGKVVRGIELKFNTLTPTECNAIQSILRSIGKEERVFVVPQTDKDETWSSEAMLCTLAEDPVVTHWDGTSTRYRSISVKLKEATY